MKFIDEFDIELVNQALQFETADCRIQGGCDLFSTRPAGSDKKLYKIIDNHLNLLLKESAELNDNPPKENPYYPTRSYSSTHTVRPFRSNSETKRRNSESLSSRNPSVEPVEFKHPKLDVQKLEELSNSKSNAINNNNNISNDNNSENQALTNKKPRRKSQVSHRKSSVTERPIFARDIIRRRSMSSSENISNGHHKQEEEQFTPPRVYDLINQSPFGPLDRSGSRKVFVYLIAVLNSTYPDHDFSLLEPSDFIKVTPMELIEKFNNSLISLGKMPMEWIWDTLQDHIDLRNCSVYYFVPSESFLEDEPGSLWSQMWFIFNKKKRRVAYLYLNAIKRSVPFRSSYYIGNGGKRRESITIDDEYDEDSYDEFEYSDYAEEALMSDIDEEGD
ncbi:RNA polymerase III-inhibiting protein [Saccharomycopsis crataegensis]|uniref:Repressor of RNA polymerase III transcription MAF1 n=1 Tax=Saccharomycopsis crataegensis TaxID=43959 RepID=A0AAV5QEQ0_9ASCO|nr:RNA polymerase III-inhibiting protein [Saccharomycopsis crataegensis]